MAHPYLCPVCRENRTHFQIIYKLAQEVRKDPHSGEILFADEEWRAIMKGDRLDVDVTCLVCDYTGHESRFIDMARRDARAAQRIR